MIRYKEGLMKTSNKILSSISSLNRKIKNTYYLFAFNESYSIEVRLKALNQLQKLTQEKDLTPRIIQVESYKEIL